MLFDQAHNVVAESLDSTFYNSRNLIRKAKSQSPSPTNISRTPSPLSKDKSAPILCRKTSWKVSTPPSLYPVADLGEIHNKEKSDKDQSIVHKVERVRRSTISYSENPMKELIKNYSLQENSNVKFLLTGDPRDSSNTALHKSKSSPALISQAVKLMPVQKTHEEMKSNLTALLKQLNFENRQQNILANLPSPSFKLSESPESPKLSLCENTPPPGVFLAASPSSWHDKLSLLRREQNRRSSRTTNQSVLNKMREETETDGNQETLDSQLKLEPQSNLSSNNSLNPISLTQQAKHHEETFLSREHLIAMEEIEFLYSFAENLLIVVADINISSYVSDILYDNNKISNSIKPTVEGCKQSKILLILEALRVATYALRFAHSHQSKGTLHVTAMLKAGK